MRTRFLSGPVGDYVPGMDGSRYIVLRFERVSDYGIGGVAAHGRREGELPHVDHERTRDNRFLIGHEDLRQLCDERIVELQRRTAERRIESFRRSRHTSKRKDLAAALEAAGDDKHALAEIAGWPWDPKNTKPWTQGVLSASPEFFQGEDGQVDPARTEEFLSFGEAYLRAEFGHEVLYARADLDEKTPHIQFVVAPEHEERRTGNPMLSHTQHRLFGMVETIEGHDEEEDERIWQRKSYELFQDRVAEFAVAYDIGLERGVRRAEEEREKIARGEEVSKRRNVRPSRGREVAAILAAEAADDRAKSADMLSSIKKTMASSERSIERRDKDSRDREAAAAEAFEAAGKMKAGAKAKSQAIVEGIAAVDDRVLDYREATPEKPAGLKYGPNAPTAKQDRKRLGERLRPAYDVLVSYARRVFNLRQSEEEFANIAASLAAEKRTFEEHRMREKAKQAARANVLSKAWQELRKRAPAPILMLIDPGSEGIDESAFPDAWAVPENADPEWIKARLDGTANLQLSALARANGDAELLSEDVPTLQAQFKRGLGLVVAEAEARGFDLETRRHHPEKATNPERAHLHTDSAPDPIRVVQKNNERVRTRD